MAFTMVKTDDAGRMLPALVCDKCRGPVGPEGFVLFGDEREDDAGSGVTSVEAFISTVKAVCSGPCRDVELALDDEEPAIVGYVSVGAYLDSLFGHADPIDVTAADGPRPKLMRSATGRIEAVPAC